MNKRRLKIGVAFGAIGSIAAMGLAHVPAVRGLVLGDTCPFTRTPSAAELEGLRVKTAANLRGTMRAAARPAFGFRLDETSREEILAWGQSVGASCEREQNDTAIRCEGARVEGGGVSDAFFRFDLRGRLVAVDVMRDGLDAAAAAELFQKLARKTTKEAGTPTAQRGESTAAALDGYQRVAAEYRFSDYAADLSATNMGAQGIIVREQYRSLN
jgi:hypothetical protein